MKTAPLAATAAALLVIAATASARPASPADGLLASIPGFTPTATGAKPPFGFEARQAKRTYVGRVRGSKANVAIVVRGKTAVGYLCDGSASLTSWLTGTNQGGKIALASDDGRRVSGLLHGGAIHGTVSAGGRTLRFTAVPAVQGKTGVWREHIAFGDSSVLRGWIIAGHHFTGAVKFPKGTVGFGGSTGGGRIGGGGGGVAPTGGQGGQQGGGGGGGAPPPPIDPSNCSDDFVPQGCFISCNDIINVQASDNKSLSQTKDPDRRRMFLEELDDYTAQGFQNGCA